MKLSTPLKWNFIWESVFELIISIAIVATEMRVSSQLGIFTVGGRDMWLNII